MLHKPIPAKKLKTKKCSHCGDPASEQFSVAMCADTSKRKGKYRPLCFDCDVKLNAMVLQFFNGLKPKTLKMIRRYKNRNRS